MPKERFKCPECGKIFGQEETFREHADIEHEGIISVDEARETVRTRFSKIRDEIDLSFGLGLLIGILMTSAAFSGYIYWDSMDHRTSVPITVVTCDNCEYDRFKSATDRMFKTNYKEVDYKSEEGQRLIERYNLKYVPGFIFDRVQLEKAENFTSVRSTLVQSEEAYIIPDEGVEVAQRLSKGITLNRSDEE